MVLSCGILIFGWGFLNIILSLVMGVICVLVMIMSLFLRIVVDVIVFGCDGMV